jgi:hypothetical protein
MRDGGGWAFIYSNLKGNASRAGLNSGSVSAVFWADERLLDSHYNCLWLADIYPTLQASEKGI